MLIFVIPVYKYDVKHVFVYPTDFAESVNYNFRN